MLCYLYPDELQAHPILRDTMFEDRAWQFKTRLNWEVSVDGVGAERDQYDDCNPLYVIWRLPNGHHGGSMRAMPTSGPCMINEHFSDITGRKFHDNLVWESTRFCLSPSSKDKAGVVSAALMLAGCEIGLRFGLKNAVGIFDPRIERIYRRIGWPPEVLGSQGQGRDKISAGIWAFSELTRRRLAQSAGVSPELSSVWFQRSLGGQKRVA